MIKLIYIGDRFYNDSGSIMSSLYSEEWQRYSWGDVNRDLANGIKVTIRPATDAELGKAHKMLSQLER